MDGDTPMRTALSFSLMGSLVVCCFATAVSGCAEDKIDRNAFSAADNSQNDDTDRTRPTDDDNDDTTDPQVGTTDNPDPNLAELVYEVDEPIDQPLDDEEPDDPIDPPLDELEGFIGSPCETASDCEFDNPMCLTDEEGYPNGMCAEACDRLCPDREGFPTTFCVDSEASVSGACHSRCDYLAYPGIGCRAGYSCQVTGRYNESSTQYGTCLPGEGPIQAESECLQWLIDQGVPFEPTTYTPRHPSGDTSLTCTVEDPVRLHSPVHGVNFRYYSDSPGEFRSMLMSCELARSLTEMSDILSEEFNINETLHIGTTVCRKISGTSRLSEHGRGTAIDLYGFFDDDANWYGLEDHWEHDTTSPTTAEGQMLYEFSERLYEEWVFNVILTPNYNAGHDNHFHVDLTVGSHFIGVHDEYWGPFLGPNTHGD